MKALKIEKINEYDYLFVDKNKKKYSLNIEFYTEKKPTVGDTIYFDDEILEEKNIFAFGDFYKDLNVEEKDIIKVVKSDGVEYYLQRYYG